MVRFIAESTSFQCILCVVSESANLCFSRNRFSCVSFITWSNSFCLWFCWSGHQQTNWVCPSNCQWCTHRSTWHLTRGSSIYLLHDPCTVQLAHKPNAWEAAVTALLSGKQRVETVLMWQERRASLFWLKSLQTFTGTHCAVIMLDHCRWDLCDWRIAIWAFWTFKSYLCIPHVFISVHSSCCLYPTTDRNTTASIKQCVKHINFWNHFHHAGRGSRLHEAGAAQRTTIR